MDNEDMIPLRKSNAGRPKGAPNKTDTTRGIEKQTQQLYRDILPMLTPEQRTYFDLAFQGKAEFDSVHESELFLRFFSVYLTKMLSAQVADPDTRVLKDFGSILGQYNTALKTLEDMKNKRVEMELKQKNGNDTGVDTLSRESALGRLESIHRRHPTDSTNNGERSA